MKYTCEKAEKSQVKFTVTIEKADWDSAIMQAYHKMKGKINIQGFRKGKAPFNVICAQYGKDIFFEDAINIAIQKHYPEVLAQEKDIHVVGDPQISLNNFAEDEVVFDALVPVMPEITLESYKGIKIKKVEYNVSDEDVDADVNRLLEKNSNEVEVTDRPCQNGDTVVIDFSGSVDGKKFDGGTAENYRLGLGSNSFVPGFEDQVCGMNIGESKDITVTFPEDYVEDLKGKEAVFAIKLHKIIVKELPELTDEFIKDKTGEESIEAYKAKIRADLEKNNTRRANDENENNLLDAIAEKMSGDIPDAMVENEVTSMIQQLEYRLMYQGLKFDDYLNMTGQTIEGMREIYKEQALSRVKKQLIVNKIIELEGIKASKEEIDAKIAEQAASVSKEVEEYEKSMDPRQKEYIENSIVVDKLFNFLMSENIFE